MSNQNFFDAVDFDNVEAPTTEERKYPQLRPNSWYAGRVIEEMTDVTDKGAPCLITVLAPLDGGGEPSKPSVRHKLWLPRVKVDEEGNKIPWKGSNFLIRYSRAFEGRDIFPYPVRKYKGVIRDSDGNELTQAEADAFNNELTENAKAYVMDRCRNIGQGIGKEVYFKTTPAETNKGRTYVNVDFITSNLPEDVELMTNPDEWTLEA